MHAQPLTESIHVRSLVQNVDEVREEELRKEAERKRLEEEAARVVEEIVVPKSVLRTIRIPVAAHNRHPP